MHIPDQESRGHISPTGSYIFIGGMLLFLTVLTVGASYIDWGSTLINVLIAVVIASIKASLVIMYFMHMKYENKLVWGFGLLYPIVLFSILISMAMIDVFLRVIPVPSQQTLLDSATTMLVK